MSGKVFSRRDFLKLASLSAFSLAAGPSRNTPSGLERLPGMKPAPRPIFPHQMDVLTYEQKNRLLNSSRHYIALDENQANQVALEIDFIEGFNEHASNMCGPLSISILQRAELLGTWVEPRDFWLLNPREDLRSAVNAFPFDLYDWYHFETPISEFDFSRFPLQAGDLLYLHAGPSDTFEHILVVNRVDKFGRAYSVTNFFTEFGTVIDERMLYDPDLPGEGQFQTWADRKYRSSIGITGSGGFRLWRVKDGRSLEFPADSASRNLRQSLTQTLLSGGGAWFATIKIVNGPTVFQFNPYERFHPASTIKVAVAMAFYAWLDNRQEEDFAGYLNSRGTRGRSYAQLLEGMIVESEEEATETLVEFLGIGQIEATLTLWDLDKITLSPRRGSAGEISQLLEGLYTGQWLSSQSRAHLLDLMATYTENDDTRIGIIRDQLPTGSSIYNKRGSLVPAPRVVADSGIIDLPADGSQSERVFTYSIHGLGTDGSSYEALEAKLDQAVWDFGAYLTSA